MDSRGHIDRLIEAFDPLAPMIVVRSAMAGAATCAVAQEFLLRSGRLSGDIGARGLIERFASTVRSVPFDTDAIFVDVDTPEQLDRRSSD